MEIWSCIKPIVLHVRWYPIICMTHETLQCINLTQNNYYRTQPSMPLRRYSPFPEQGTSGRPDCQSESRAVWQVVKTCTDIFIFLSLKQHLKYNNDTVKPNACTTSEPKETVIQQCSGNTISEESKWTSSWYVLGYHWQMCSFITQLGLIHPFYN